MPRGKEFCQGENGFFDKGEFRLMDGTLVHDVAPLHRTDGVLVKVQGANEKVTPVNEVAIDPIAGLTAE